MSVNIDQDLLNSIAQEARQCFLEEDAPEYLATLQHTLTTPNTIDYPAVLRAAHSLKGGAGLAQIPTLSTLAHKLEDIFEALRDRRVDQVDLAMSLVDRCVQEIADVLDQAQSDPEAAVDSSLIQALDTFTQALSTPTPADLVVPGSVTTAPFPLIKTALEVDLEECLKRVESLMEGDPNTLSMALQNLVDECGLLAETLNLGWLSEATQALGQALERPQPDLPLSQVARMVIDHIRNQRADFLQQPQAEQVPTTSDRLTKSEESLESRSGPLTSTQPQVRLPLSQVETMTDQLGELIIRYERLSIQQHQLKQASQELQRLSQQFQPLRDQIQVLYDQMSTQHGSPLNGELSPDEFDPLELDKYTALHRSLQTFEELITRIQETRADIDLVNRELLEDVEQGRQEVDALYHDVTQARLVPFQTLAQRFIPRLKSLAQRFQKQAELLIAGGDVLIDRVLLEQLQTPLMHILNNAVDHGLEPTSTRVSMGKPEVATIKLEAKLEGNQVVVFCRDDGQGIDLNRVYQKAVECGLCAPNVKLSQLSRETVLNFIFQPGFSTAASVSDVSGRGVGLDVVRGQISQLRGSLQVNTLPGQGTEFTIRLPLGLNLIPLMLCQSQRHIIGIPATNVLEILLFRELVPDSDAANDPEVIRRVRWRDQEIPVLSLATLLPYAYSAGELVYPRVVIVLSGADFPIGIAIEALLGERQLILKPFDDTVVVPSYVAGCTILGTGEVIPVVLPYQFSTLLKDFKPSLPQSRQARRGGSTVLVAEDSVATRRALEKILTQSGYSVIACRDGQEALDELRQRQGDVDMVLTDIEMPRMTGFELLQTIRSHTQWHALPVALLTSRSGERHQQRALSLGASAYLSKPVDPKVLLKEVRTLIHA